MTDNIYFIAAAGSEAAKPVTDWLDSLNKHKEWIRAFVKRHKLGKVEWIGYNQIVVGFQPVYKKPCSWAESNAIWQAWINAHPLWRRVKSNRGSDYLVPRKDSSAAKVLAKEWADRPRPGDGGDLGKIMTGVTDFMSWMQGMRLFNAGWRLREDKSVILVVPYHVTKAKSWKPLAGLKRGNQEKLRAEWYEKE